MRKLIPILMSLACFAFFISMPLLSESIYVRSIAVWGGFASGFGCCYLTGIMFGFINDDKKEVQAGE